MTTPKQGLTLRPNAPDDPLQVAPSFETVLSAESSAPPPPYSMSGNQDIFRHRDEGSRPPGLVDDGHDYSEIMPRGVIASAPSFDSVEVEMAEPPPPPPPEHSDKKSKSNFMLYIIVASVLVVATALALGFGISAAKDDSTGSSSRLETPTPTFNDTTAPTMAPGNSTTSTDAPTPGPTAAPTEDPDTTTEPPVCTTAVQAESTCYVSGDPVNLAFDNCEPQVDDWIGVWEQGAVTDEQALPEPSRWLWLCGNQQGCDSPVSEDTLTFRNLGEGTYVAYMLRLDEDQQPYSSQYVSSAAFEISADCSP